MHRTRAITVGSITAIVLAAAVALAATTGVVGGVSTSTGTADPWPVGSAVAPPAAEGSTPAPSGVVTTSSRDDDDDDQAEDDDRGDDEDGEEEGEEDGDEGDHAGRPGSTSDLSEEGDDD